MSKILEIFGKGITVNVADLIWHWLDCVKGKKVAANYHDDFESILDHLSQFDLETAEQKLRFYLFENPTCTCGRMAAAAICLHKNCINEAINELNSVYAREPANTIALYAMGNCYERLGLEEQAIEFYQDALKFKNYLELPRKRLAAIYLKNGQADRAIREYEELRHECPDDIASLVLLGHLYLRCGKVEEAIETFNRAILIHPDNFHCEDHDELDMMIAAGEYECAIQRLENITESEPDRADIQIKLGDVLVMAGNEIDALAAYSKAFELEPACLEACVKLGTGHMRNGHLALAAKLFGKAMEINDEIVDAYMGLAKAQNIAGKTKESTATLSLAAAIAPNSVLLFGQMAMLQYRQGRETGVNEFDGSDLMGIDSTDEIMQQVLNAQARQVQQQPENADAHYRFGMLIMGGGNFAAAARNFETALSINPVFYRARTKLAVCYHELDRKGEALASLSGTAEPETTALNLYYQTAVLFADRSRFDLAAQRLQKLLSENLSSTQAAPALSSVLQNLGLVDRASMMLESTAKLPFESQ